MMFLKGTSIATFSVLNILLLVISLLAVANSYRLTTRMERKSVERTELAISICRAVQRYRVENTDASVGISCEPLGCQSVMITLGCPSGTNLSNAASDVVRLIERETRSLPCERFEFLTRSFRQIRLSSERRDGADEQLLIIAKEAEVRLIVIP
jgi:hypothetical protein